MVFYYRSLKHWRRVTDFWVIDPTPFVFQAKCRIWGNDRKRLRRRWVQVLRRSFPRKIHLN